MPRDDVPFGPIDNTPLTDNGAFPRDGLAEDLHFSIISESLWNAYFGWYGGGRVLSFPVVASKSGSAAGYRRMPLEISHKGERRPLSILSVAPISEFKAQALALFSRPPSTETRLIYYDKDKFQKVLDESKLIESATVTTRQLVVLDHNIGGEWATPDPPPPSPSSDR
jgi:hypothetical protein